MSKVYPSSITLNIQISLGYSKFLDSHITNLKHKGSMSITKLTTSLAYKPLSRFEYVPYSSNIHNKHKGCIVSSFLHRVFNRTTLTTDISCHIQFLKTILNHRNQNRRDILDKMEQIQVKKKRSILRPSKSIITSDFKQDFQKMTSLKTYLEFIYLPRLV